MSPRAFLLGLLYDHSSRFSVDMHEISFQCRLANSNEKCGEGEYIIEGLHLHNAIISNGYLTQKEDSYQNTVLVSIKVQIIRDSEMQNSDNLFHAPVYYSGSTTDANSLMGIQVRINIAPSDSSRVWSLRRC